MLPLFRSLVRRSPRPKYLSFEEAREWARAQGLSNQEEWRKLGPRRPDNIPYSPWAAYQGYGYKGMRDFLGVRGTLIESARADELPSEMRTTRQEHHDRGIALVKAALLKHAGDRMNIIAMPFTSGIRLLLAEKSEASPECNARVHDTTSWSWAALSVNSRQPSDGHENRMGSVFNLIVRSKATIGSDVGIVCVDLDAEDFLFIRNDILVSGDHPYPVPPGRQLFISRSSGTKYARSFVPAEDLAHLLVDHCRTAEKKTVGGWLRSASVSKCHAPFHHSLASMWESLFAPLNLTVNFNYNSASLHTYEIDGVRILHRTSSSARPGHGHGFYIRQRLNGREVAVSAEDKVDFVCFSVKCEESLSPEPGAGPSSIGSNSKGCFLIPIHELVERGVVSRNGSPAENYVFLYTPDASSFLASCRKEWQLPYYINLDFSTEADVLASGEKFMKILHDNHPVLSKTQTEM